MKNKTNIAAKLGGHLAEIVGLLLKRLKVLHVSAKFLNGCLEEMRCVCEEVRIVRRGMCIMGLRLWLLLAAFHSLQLGRTVHQ